MSSAGIGIRPERTGWLFGRGIDLWIGCGLGYVLSVPILAAVGAATGATEWPNILVLLLMLSVNAPHYGATIVRVYESREDRQKYVVFSVFITLALAVVLFASSWNMWVASLVITVFLTWNSWHFSGQNYGLMLMFLRRRGIDVDPTTKRLVYGSFVLSAALAILAVHAGDKGLVFAPQTLHVANTPSIMFLPIPAWLSDGLLRAMVVAYLGCLAGMAWRLTRRARLVDIAPAFILVLTQSLFSAIPAVAFKYGEARHGTLFFAAAWLSTAHSAQYLWVTAYYARQSARGTSTGGFLLKSVVAGTAVTTLPAVLLAPGLLGNLPFDAGMAATVFAIVNLHHFILDGAIWKLRDGRVARILLRTSDQPKLADPIPAPPSRSWMRRLVWTVAGLSLAIPVAELVALTELRGSTERDRIESANRLLRWTGRERIETNVYVGRRFAAAGNHADAMKHFRRSIELFPTARAWALLGVEHRALGDWESALAAFDAALELNPDFWGAHYQRAEALLETASSETAADARDQAAESLERALELSPAFAKAAQMLARLQAASGRADQAILTLERAIEANRQTDVSSLRRQLAELQAASGSSNRLD